MCYSLKGYDLHDILHKCRNKNKIFWPGAGHWPICVVLFTACFTSLFLLDDGSYLVHVVGAIGIVIFLPLFKLENVYGFMYQDFFVCNK
jgi:hypothetical protein